MEWTFLEWSFLKKLQFKRVAPAEAETEAPAPLRWEVGFEECQCQFAMPNPQLV